jgi:hypothetical protein
VIFGFPTAADGDGFRLFELQNEWLNICHRVRAVAERQVFTSGAAAVGDAFRNLSDNGGFDQVIVGERHEQFLSQFNLLQLISPWQLHQCSLCAL